MKTLIKIVVAFVVTGALLLPGTAGARDPVSIEKVLSDLQPADPEVLKAITALGVDKEYVELTRDYDVRSADSSPYSRTYKDRKSDYYFLEVSQLPMVDAEGDKLKVGWYFYGGKYYTNSGDKTFNNLFWAEVAGIQITVIAVNDQPNGTKAGDQATWQPQLFLDGKEIRAPPSSTLLDTDPTNENYHQNVLEWDYGICKRRIRVIEGRIWERWVFDSNPNGEIKIKHNISGTLPLKLGRGRDSSGERFQVQVEDDAEIIPASEFNRDDIVYPLEIGASPETFYPDAHIETSSVDGLLGAGSAYGGGFAWADIRVLAEANMDVDDDGTDLRASYIHCDNQNNKWVRIIRSPILFDTSALPPGTIVTAVTLSVRGDAKADPANNVPSTNVYSSAPANNDELVAGDFDSFGTTPFCDTPIAYGDWNTAGYNNFLFNATGRAAVDINGVSKFGLRDVAYDVGLGTPNWVNSAVGYMRCFSADQGNTGSDPKLVVTYVVLDLPVVTAQVATNIEATTATGSGNITDVGVGNCTRRGFVWDLATQADPGNVAPGASGYANDVGENGNFGTGAYTLGLTGLPTGDTIYYRAYAQNADGYDYSDTEINFLTKPVAPTNVSASDGTSADNVTITWTKSTGATDYQVYRDGGALGWIGDVATYDDTGSDNGTVTPGTASASDGSALAYVTLSLAGEGINNGTTHTYKVRAKNATGESVDSATDTGYETPSNLVYQWYRSAGDSDASYGVIGGATTDPYNDTGAPANGDGRWYLCEVNATGASADNSTHDRGYRAVAPTVTTEPCTGFDKNWAIVNGNIVSEGTSSVTQVGFDYGLTTIYGSSWNATGSWTTGDDFWMKLTNLTPATVYHFRAKAYNTVWGYGGDRVFSTEGSPTLYEHLNTGSDNESGAIYSANWTAEQFTSDNISHTVTSVRVPLKRVGTYPGNVELALTYADSDNFSTGVDLTIGILNGNAMSDIDYVWYDFDVTDITLDESAKYTVVVKALSGNATDYILWQRVDAGALDNAVGSHSMNSGITWVSDSPADYLFEIWGETVISVERVAVFTGYIETGDWIVVLTYKNTYAPYYPNDDPEAYFYIQLIDDTTVKAQVNCPMWGYRPGSIYISESLADSLEWGKAYKIRLYGDFGTNPATDYVLTALDWRGAELSFLDSWVIAQANDIGDHYNVALTTDVADLGEVLNEPGHTIFSNGIYELNQVRPGIFEMAVRQPEYEAEDHTGAMDTATDLETKIGSTIYDLLETGGGIVNTDAEGFGGFLVFIFAMVIMIVASLLGNFSFGVGLGYVPLLGGAWIGVLDWVLIGVITFLVGGFILVYKVWLTK